MPRRQTKYFLISPTSITLEMKGSAALISFYMRIGGIFSPPAVMINSFARPVMKSTPLSVILPISPEWRYP